MSLPPAKVAHFGSRSRTNRQTAKVTARTGRYHGCFVKLVMNEQVVEVDEFESTDPRYAAFLSTTSTAPAAPA